MECVRRIGSGEMLGNGRTCTIAIERIVEFAQQGSRIRGCFQGTPDIAVLSIVVADPA
jgi:hypothetical protein